MVVLYIILGLIALFLAIILLRTAMFRPKPQGSVSQEPVEFDRERAVETLAALIRCKTVSFHDKALEERSFQGRGFRNRF